MYSGKYGSITIVVQPVGQDEYAEIINEGSGELDLSGANLNAGDKGQDFKFPSGLKLAPGAKVRIYTNKATLGPGEFSYNRKTMIWNDQGDVPVLTDANGNLLAIVPVGIVQKPIISVTLNDVPTTAHDFGTSKIGLEGNRVSFTISNIGGSNLVLARDVTISGPDATSFSVKQQPAKELAGGAKTTLVVEFCPKAKDSKQATLTIVSNDSYRNTVTIALSGLGKAGEAALELSSKIALTDGLYHFGSQIIGGDGREETFTIKNTGDENLVLTGNPPVQPDMDNSGFTIAGPASTTIAPGGTTTFTVKFKPTGGLRSATFSIPYGTDPARSQTFAVAGKGVGPEINIKEAAADLAHGAASRNFGTLRPGQQSSAMTFTIENQGDAALQLTGNPPVSIVGPNAADFKVVSQPAASVDIGGHSSFSISFAPQSTGAKRAQISIASTDLDENPYLIDLVGKAGIQVAGPPRHVAITYRNHYVLRAGGTVWSTGGAQIPGLTAVVAIFATYHRELHVIKADGSLWGGHGTQKILDGVVDLGLGQDHMVVLRDDGTVWARGKDYAGQVGTGPEREAGFREVSGLRDVVAVAASCAHSAALRSDGTVWTWGNNVNGFGPWGLQQIPNISGVVCFSMNDTNNGSVLGSHVIMGLADGQVLRAGWRDSAVPNISYLMTLPGRPAGVVCSLDQTASAMAFTESGELWSVGTNMAYRLGHGQLMQNMPPSRVTYSPLVSAMATNSHHTVALAKDASVWDWGMLNLGKPPPHCYVQSPRRNPWF